jgi:DNA-sulfur modification-associated
MDDNDFSLPPASDTETETREYNVPIYGTYGEFTLSPEVKVPYMVSLMDLKRVTKELKTHDEVSPSLENSYSLTELFQREIDVDRVKNDIVNGYLKDKGKLKFFNALTIVLLPKDDSGRIQQDFVDYPENDPAIPHPGAGHFDVFFDKPNWRKAIFGGVQFVSTTSANISRLRWDMRRVDAVAVDGQHRLRALKEWIQEKNNELVEVEKPTRIPIIFLLLHKNAGFAHADQLVSLKAIAREIFTDLNKNARQVDQATTIVLDDRSIESLCVRSLVTEGTCEDQLLRLPLSLVRWQEANNRFDQKYFLNSLVHLHSLVSELLDLDAPRKIDKDAGLKFVRRVQYTLGHGNPPKLVVSGKDLETYYKDHYLDENGDEAIAPITAIPPAYLGEALLGFKDRFLPWLVRILTELAPYQELLAYARAEKIITGDFSKYLSQPKRHLDVLKNELAAKYGDNWMDEVVKNHEQAILKIKGVGRSEDDGGEFWAFKAIFQKALVKLAKVVFFDVPESERTRFGQVGDFLDFFGGLHKHGLLSVHSKLKFGDSKHGLWVFVSVSPISRKIQVVNTAEKRINAVLALAYYAWRYAAVEGLSIVYEKTGVPNEISVKEILDKMAKSASTTSWPDSSKYYAEIRDQFINNCEYIDPGCEDKASKKAKSNAESRMVDLFATLLINEFDTKISG